MRDRNRSISANRSSKHRNRGSRASARVISSLRWEIHKGRPPAAEGDVSSGRPRWEQNAQLLTYEWWAGHIRALWSGEEDRKG